jgi:pimeloyl-ACP methyl ester carboxylesterase
MTSSEIRNEAGERLDTTFHHGQRMDSLVILGHGLTGNKDRPLLIAVAEGLEKKGWACLRISYAGNGESEGRFEDSTISKEVRDLTAIIDDVPDYVKVAYIGHSMGGAVGVMTAAHEPRIRALVSLAGMTFTAEFVEREFSDVVPGQGVMWEEPEHPLSQAYVDDLKTIGSTLESAARVVQPWLLIHGSEDDVVPPSDGKAAFEAATSKKQWLEIAGAGHVFDAASYPQIIEAIDAWLTTHLV